MSHQENYVGKTSLTVSIIQLAVLVVVLPRWTFQVLR